MTTATQDGRRLRLDIEGLDPMWVEPLSSRRGRFLTDEFIAASIGQRSVAQSTEIFIEAVGPANYSRIDGRYVVQHDEESGAVIAAYDRDGAIADPNLAALALEEPGPRYSVHEQIGDRHPADGDPIRQEEGEEICMCAFYWQTVVGMEAVQAFLGADEGNTVGSLKALALLQTRLGLSPLANSRSKGMESLIQQGVSEATTATAPSSGSVLLDAVPTPRRPLDRLPKGLLGRARSRTS